MANTKSELLGRDQAHLIHSLHNRAAHELATGRVENVHQAMIAMEKADVSFRLMVEARNRIVKAYEEVMKMQG